MITIIERKVTDKYNNNLNLYIWDNCTQVNGVIQIMHGVNEQGLRYVEFAEFLNKQGYIVYLADHLSQGKSRLQNEETVYFGKQGDELIQGLLTVKDEISNDYPNIDKYLIGHSLGALIIREYLIDYNNEYKKIVLSGSGLAKTTGIGLMILIGNFLSLFGKKKPSRFFDNLFRKTQLKLNEKVQINHFIEWLTRDTKKNEQDKLDKYLYISLSVSAFVRLLKLFKKTSEIKNINKTDKGIEFLLLSGTHDPSTNFGEDTIKLNATFNEYGMKSIIKLYPEGRHDNLQEINRLKIYNDIVKFYRK